MVQCRICRTGRHRIRHESCRAAVVASPAGDQHQLDVLLELAEYGFPENARVFVELRGRGFYQRFDWGSVGALGCGETPSIDPVALDGGMATLRVLVVESRATGRLLGLANRIPLSRDSESRSLLGTALSEELGDLVWDLELSEEGPVLLINKKVGEDSSLLVKRREFLALVLPEAFRRVLSLILHGVQDEEPPPDSWQGAWLRFSAVDLGAGRPPMGAGGDDSTDLDEWIQDAVRRLAAKRIHCAQTYREHLRKQEA